MKIALLSFSFEQHCVPLANGLAEAAEVGLLLSKEQAAPYSSRLSPAVTFLPFDKPRLREPIRQMRMIRRLLQQIRSFNPDVVHLQQGHLWFNLALTSLRPRPLVVTVHDAKSHVGDVEWRRTPQRIMQIGFARATQIIVHSQHVRRAVIEEAGVPGERVHLIPLTLPDETAARVTAAGSKQENIVLFFGRIWEYKGLEFLIRAEPLITSKVPDAKIVIAGRGEDFSRYRKLMVHPENFIVYNEHIPDDRRAKLFADARIVVLPYIEASQSGVIPLAYLYSRPVVATTVGGLKEMVEDGRTGYLVPARNARALADKIVHLLKDPQLCRTFGANGKQKIETECCLSSIAQQTMRVYEAALQSQSSPTQSHRGVTRIPA